MDCTTPPNDFGLSASRLPPTHSPSSAGHLFQPRKWLATFANEAPSLAAQSEEWLEEDRFGFPSAATVTQTT